MPMDDRTVSGLLGQLMTAQTTPDAEMDQMLVTLRHLWQSGQLAWARVCSSLLRPLSSPLSLRPSVPRRDSLLNRRILLANSEIVSPTAAPRSLRSAVQ
jgi:hypothetical protein